MLHVHPQCVHHRSGVQPRFGRQHFDALRQQHRSLALHLHPALQVLNHTNSLGQLALDGCQRLTAQRRACLGGVALPRHRIGDVEFCDRKERLRPGLPFGRQRLLAFGALGLINALAYQFRGTLVLDAQFPKHIGQLLWQGVR